MIEILMTIFMWFGAALAGVFVLGMWVLCLIVINEEANALFKHRRNDRFANKLFNKIEEYRRDFS